MNRTFTSLQIGYVNLTPEDFEPEDPEILEQIQDAKDEARILQYEEDNPYYFPQTNSRY